MMLDEMKDETVFYDKWGAMLDDIIELMMLADDWPNEEDDTQLSDLYEEDGA